METTDGLKNDPRHAGALPVRLILAISAVQGFALLAVYTAFDHNTWPSSDPSSFFPIWTLCIVPPALLVLTLDRNNVRRAVLLTALFSVVLGAVAWYVGWQVEPQPQVPMFNIAMIFALSIALACFKALIYLQQQANRAPLDYQVLFAYSWRNFLTAALALAFVGGVGLVLVLWAALFSAVGIDLFARWFTEAWFLIPVLSVSFGAAVVIFRNLTGTIDGITRLLEGLIRLLLPLLAVVLLIFLAVLPFAGLAPLWEAWSGTAILLWLAAFVLFSVNAVYQTGREEIRYPTSIQILVAVGIVTLPVVSGLSFYGLWLRVAQYGWTVERCWAGVVWLLLAGLSIGYAYGVVRHRLRWPHTLARVNTYAGLGLLLVLMLANSPFVDFRKISLRSQVNRVELGDLSWQQFDHFYAFRNLGRPAFALRQRLLSGVAANDAELRAMIEDPRPMRVARTSSDAVWEQMVFRPDPFDVPDELIPLVEGSVAPTAGAQFVMFKLDLDADGIDEYVLLSLVGQRVRRSVAFHRAQPDGDWQSRWLHPPQQEAGSAETILTGEIRTVEPAFDDLEIGGLRFEVR